MSDIASRTADPPASFEAALAELENIVATMEGGQLPLAESLAAYKRGAELLQYCQGALRTRSNRCRCSSEACSRCSRRVAATRKRVETMNPDLAWEVWASERAQRV